MMADDLEIDLNPISAKEPVVKKRPRDVPVAPPNGPLIVTIHTVVLRGETMIFTKARYSKEKINTE